MDPKSIIQNALTLSPSERVFIIEALSQSLSEPDDNIEAFWKEEVEKRYSAFLQGKVKGIPYEKAAQK